MHLTRSVTIEEGGEVGRRIFSESDMNAGCILGDRRAGGCGNVGGEPSGGGRVPRCKHTPYTKSPIPIHSHVLRAQRVPSNNAQLNSDGRKSGMHPPVKKIRLSCRDSRLESLITFTNYKYPRRVIKNRC